MDTPPIVADLTAAVAAMDRACVKVVARLIERREQIAEQTGVTADVWLANQTRLPRWQRRALLQAAEVLPHLPATWNAWQDGALSWEIVRRIVGEVARVGRAWWTEADRLIADAAEQLDGAEPDWLYVVLSEWLDRVDQARRAKAEARGQTGDWLMIQPRLDGTGGRIVADYSAVPFATITDAIRNAAPNPDDLQPDPDGDVDTRAHNRLAVQAADAAGLLALCSANSDGQPKRPLLLATAPLDVFTTGASDDAVRLLTTLTGGELRLTATAARRLRDAHPDVDLRLVLHDHDGASVGVGRRTRVPTGWLRDVSLTAQTTCTFPGCRRAARTAQLDHAVEWHPGRGAGPTDAHNLHPVCAAHHTLKTDATTAGESWTVDIDPDGTVTWTHPAGVRHTQPSLPKLRALARPPG